jgi:hypothetical protein
MEQPVPEKVTTALEPLKVQKKSVVKPKAVEQPMPEQ